MHDTWAARDLPVLDATVSLLEQSYMVTVTDIAARTGLEAGMVARALETLDPVYVDFRKTTTGGDPRFWYVFKVTPQARRAVGQWPTPEALANRLADELAAAAQHETDAERQGLLAYAARLIGDTLQPYTVRAAASVLAPAVGSLPEPDDLPVPPPISGPLPEPEAQPAPAVLPDLAALPEPDAAPPAAGPEPEAAGLAGDAGEEPQTAGRGPGQLAGRATFPGVATPSARPAWPTWPAVDSPAAGTAGTGDADAEADTDLDLVQARTETG